MKKLLFTLLASSSLMLNPAFAADSIDVTNSLGNQQTLPMQPQRIAAFDLGALDTVRELGNSENIVAVPSSTRLPEYLSEFNDAKYLNVGSLVDPNFEKLNEAEPDLNIISSRQSKFTERFEEIAPSYFSGITIDNFYPSFKQNILNIAVILDKKDVANQKLADLDKKMEQIKAKAQGKTALILLISESKVSTFGEASRFGIIYQGFGFTSVDNNVETATHGMNVGFEYILEKNPDYIFVVDRTAAVTNTKDNAATVLNNDIVKQTKAYQNGHIIYLNPENWYLAMGGLKSMESMSQEVEDALSK
ncbi:siderophore ABC transporter substrate-binding protein [Otariodibacter oris]|uniref:Iron complex transport system substrate-binding protein n=1 Tax=Otariodibacter oris TaxID=1032623 RepID=A0A420XGV5_9PAST|nr:ABC transporter substrate-binding protein [Otariodibacter oris]QGM80066.1 ABC transporter [Otariodibacter oris]RKR71891.1 iron complex transport system substrate-binding protein [Otariodibacter oris]